ncbi:MAG: hypothetical protein AVDCRST_MAG56-2637 [uncultured Cytophagales bacterium]|uniref:Secretion system C-terminal sorting domain-containing protein n=1 Tax=uncultured Cytophagales bacterium TaxID=158755 RepID=A0A6J4IZL9_9SPHI|nr:MAG: hypothetical protein AVDCRST_MAG56-2637 [uncultured Cytophagales bacterium]
MKTLLSLIVRNASRGGALLGLATLFAAAPAALAQQSDLAHRTNVHKVAGTSQAFSSGELQAVMFPAANPMKVKVSFANPALERIVMSVRNESGEILHTSVVGRHKSYVTQIDLTALPDGDYTLQLRGEDSRYVQSFRIQTETARLALVE